jgi:geranylgeranyl diphosphate synthase type I
VEAALTEFLHERREPWVAVDAHTAAAFDSLAELTMAPAKRIRAAMCHWGARIAGRPELDDVMVDAGAGLELLQAFALVHDDIMDRSDRRRGQPTAHITHRDLHAESDWLGDPTHYGYGAAILVGNMAHVYADELLVRAAGSNAEVWHEWNALRSEVNIGQFLDLNGTARRSRSIAEVNRILHYKSVTYTIVRPLYIGAALAGRLSEHRDQLEALGTPLGRAFQLRDDVLGAVGDETLTGKPVGDDLREGKATPLIVDAMEHASEAQRSTLAALGNPELTEAQIEAMGEILRSTGALDRSLDEIAALADEASAVATTMTLDATSRDELLALINFIARRDR